MPLFDIPHISQALVNIDPRRGAVGTVDDKWYRFFSDMAEDPLKMASASLVLVDGANANVKLPRARFLEITGPANPFSISGLAGGSRGREVILYNTTAQAMTITNDATSAAANRILTMTGSDRATTGTGLVMLIYSAVSSRWIVTSFEA